MGVGGKINTGDTPALRSVYADLITRTPATSRIPLSSTFLVELVNSVYFCMFNDVALAGLQALEEIHQRAIYHLHTDVLLVSINKEKVYR